MENEQGFRVNMSFSGLVTVTANADGNITPSDATNILNQAGKEFVAKGLRIENIVTGNTIRFETEDGSIGRFILSEFEVGYHPGNFKKIFSTGTTATLKIFALR